MDRKRVYGPEESVKPIMACNENTNAFDRTNERDLDQIRSIFAKHGIIPQASGSVFFESGKTKIFAAVYGPRAVTKGKESFETGQICCEFKYACFATAKRATYAPSQKEIEYGILIQQALESIVQTEKFPKSVLDVYVHVIEDDGGALGHSITALTLALLDAEIEMKDVMVGISIGFLDDKVVIDPTMEESLKLQASLDVFYLPSRKEFSQVLATGSMSGSALSKVLYLLI